MPELPWDKLCQTCGVLMGHHDWCPRRPRPPKASVPELLSGFAWHCFTLDLEERDYKNDSFMQELAREYLAKR